MGRHCRPDGCIPASSGVWVQSAPFSPHKEGPLRVCRRASLPYREELNSPIPLAEPNRGSERLGASSNDVAGRPSAISRSCAVPFVDVQASREQGCEATVLSII